MSPLRAGSFAFADAVWHRIVQQLSSGQLFDQGPEDFRHAQSGLLTTTRSRPAIGLRFPMATQRALGPE